MTTGLNSARWIVIGHAENGGVADLKGLNVSDQMDEAIHKRIEAKTTEGNRLADEGDYVAAKDRFWEAFDLVPEPKSDWEATTWILASIGDMWFLLGEHDKARDAFRDAVSCVGGLGNPFIHLRLGEIAFDAGDTQRAADELARAYMAGGRDAFEHEDPKYIQFLETVLRPPLGQDRL